MKSNKLSEDTIIRREVTTFLNNSECELSTPSDMFIAIYRSTNGQPCADCALKPCALLNRFKHEDIYGYQSKPKVHSCDLKTNAELAAMHGITKRQVAKRRIPGTNDLRSE